MISGPSDPIQCDADGQFHVDKLLPGDCELRIDLKGYRNDPVRITIVDGGDTGPVAISASPGA